MRDRIAEHDDVDSAAVPLTTSLRNGAANVMATSKSSTTRCDHGAGWFECDRVGIFAEDDRVALMDFSSGPSKIKTGPAVFRVRLKCNAKCGATRFAYIKASVVKFGPISLSRG